MADAVATPDKIVKVKLTEPNVDQAQGKMRAGGVYELPQEQAIRYVRAGIARPAPASAKTAREEDRELRLADARERVKMETLDQEMSAAWDVDVRDVDRRQFELEAAEARVEELGEAVKVSKAAQGRARPTSAAQGRARPTSPEPGPVETEGDRPA